METVLFEGGTVWDGTGKPAFPADVLIAGNRIAQLVPQARSGIRATRRIDVTGHTITPGRVDGHAHLPFLHKADIAETGDVPPEEHTLETAVHARIVPNAGFTPCLRGARAR